MEKTTLIKLRQHESSDVSQNGVYSVALKEPILMAEGDIVKLHTAILDTSSDSFVILQDDTDITMRVVQYVRNWQSNYPATTTFQHDPIINDSQPDLNVYMPCYEATLTGNEYKIGNIRVFAHPLASRKTEAITVAYHYNDPDTGLRKNDTIFIRAFAGISHSMDGFTVNINKLCRGQSVVIDTPASAFKSARIILDPYPKIEYGNGGNPINPVSTSVAQIFEQELNFTLSAGRYLPSEMATILTDKMSQLESLGEVGYDVALKKFPVMSPFLSTLAQINHKIESAVVDGGLAKVAVWCPTVTDLTEFPTDCLTYATPANNADDRLIGANEISMNYDDTLKKLNFDALHMPFYLGGTADGGGQPGCRYPALAPTFLMPNTLAREIAHIPQQNYGGVFFTHLEPTEFWVDQLGFQNITVNGEIANEGVPRLAGKDDLLMSQFLLTDGLNTVGAYKGLDNIVFKNDDFNKPVLGDVSTALTTPIISSREFDKAIDDEGYFLIEVGMNFPQKMVGGATGDNTTSNSVQCVMGKYFTSGNFLQETGQGSIVYQHQGEPQLLSNISVAVRNGDMSFPVAHELGDKNSIFLELIKQVPTQISQKK
jgi:hypothetical protein